MHIFEVHSNENACRKKVRLGLEQVYSKTLNKPKLVSEFLNFESENFTFVDDRTYKKIIP